MKHVFYVHSFVTYLVTLGVIEHENIVDNDVVLILARGGVEQNRFKCIDIEDQFADLFGIPCYASKFYYLKNRNRIRAFDKRLSEYCSHNSFNCYLPTNKHYLQQLILSHPDCIRINFIEEGLFTYNDEYRKTGWPFEGIGGKIKRYLNTGNRNVSPKISGSLDKFTLYTLFDPKNYKGNVNKICVMPNIADIPYDGIKLNKANVLMMNAFRDASSSVVPCLLNIIKEFAKSLHDRNESIFIKHHPYSSTELKDSIENIFNTEKVKYTVLPNKLNTELMLFNSKELKIYGFFSAAMLYGAMMGHESISFVKLFESCSDECKEYLKINFHIPSVFLEHSKIL